MALSIKNKTAEQLAADVAEMTGQSMTAAVIEALETYKIRVSRRLQAQARLADVVEFLEYEVWNLPDASEPPLAEDELLGYGPGGA